jgi:hypothetical protein
MESVPESQAGFLLSPPVPLAGRTQGCNRSNLRVIEIMARPFVDEEAAGRLGNHLRLDGG